MCSTHPQMQAHVRSLLRCCLVRTQQLRMHARGGASLAHAHNAVQRCDLQLHTRGLRHPPPP
jgi:hypothetical protein